MSDSGGVPVEPALGAARTALRRPRTARGGGGPVRTTLLAFCTLPLLAAVACGGAGDDGESSEAADDQPEKVAEEKPSPADEKVRTWQVSNSDRGQYDYGLGAWLHEDLVVNATTTDVLAVDASTGEEAWRFEPPEVDGKPAEFCGASERAVDGRVALAYGVGGEPEPGVRRHCTDVLLLDLTTRKVEWSKNFMGGEDDVDSLSLPQQIAYVELVGEDTVESVAVGYLRYVRVLDAAGDERWFQAVRPPEGSSSSAHCGLGDMTTEGSRLVILADCSDAPTEVLWVDSTSGDVARDTELAPSAIGGEPAAGGVLHTEPTVLSVMLDDRTFEYLTVNDSDSIDQVIENPESSGTEQIDFSAKSSPDGARPYHRDAFGDGLLATVTVGAPSHNKLMLYDLANGEQRWKKGLGPGWKFQPISVDESGVTALAVGEIDNVLRVVHADADDGELSTKQEVEVPAEVIPTAWDAVLLTTEDRLVGVDLGNRTDRERAVLFSFPSKD